MGKNVRGRPCRGGKTIDKTYSSGVDGMKEHIFAYGGHNVVEIFNKTQKELLNYIL